MFYMAGIGAYRQQLGAVAENGFEGFEMVRDGETVAV